MDELPRFYHLRCLSKVRWYPHAVLLRPPRRVGSGSFADFHLPLIFAGSTLSVESESD